MRNSWRWWLPATVCLALAPSLALAQRPFASAREVLPGTNVQDTGDIWTLGFEFVDPRMIEVNIPGKGKKVVWYMMYWLTNNNKEPNNKPLQFIPEFLLMTKNSTLHYDEVVPEVHEAIRRVEDPNNRFNFQNSVSIRKALVQPTKPDSMPRRVAGIAVWTDVFDKARNTAGFRVFVTGLSNGWAIDDEGRISRKCLRLEFHRRGDGSKVDSSEIQFADVYKWEYRDASNADVDLKRPDSVKPPGGK